MNLIDKKRILLSALIFFTAAACQSSRADDTYTFVVKKQEIKDKYRFSIADWLDTRDKMRLQDLWLALHSPSPYEFFVGGDYQLGQARTDGEKDGWEVFFAAYSSVFGLEGRYESSSPDSRYYGIFNFRFLGYQEQGTNMTLQVGLKSNDTGKSIYRNAFAGLVFSLYVSRYFGINGMYRYFFPSSPTNEGDISNSGARYQAGAFIDFRFLRVFSDYFVDLETVSVARGITAGIKLYF